MFTAGVEWRPIDNLVLTAAMKSFPQYGNDINHAQLNDGATLIDLGLRWSPVKDVDVYGNIQNLTNVQYLAQVYTVISFEGSTVSLGHPATGHAADRRRRPESEVLMRPFALFIAAGLLLAAPAGAQHQHHAKPASKPETFTASAAFGPDGTLWVVRTMTDRIAVVRSTDLGKTFSEPVTVTPEPMSLDWGPDARARIVVDPKGGLVVTFAIFQVRNFNGRAFFSRSNDNGATFTKPQPITADKTSQRFETAAVDPSTGRVFAARLDKRNVARARAAGKAYAGAALAYAWEDGEAASARVSADEWKIEACPHHGPSIAIAPDGSQHVAWYTEGSARKGRFHARADNADMPFGQPRALSAANRQPARPFVLSNGNALYLVWKEFDGTKSLVRWQVSGDGGRQWREPRTVADTADASDHPLLVAHAGQAYLSWLTKADGYRLIPLGDKP